MNSAMTVMTVRHLSASSMAQSTSTARATASTSTRSIGSETIETRTIKRACFGARERALDPEHLAALRKRGECERKSRGRAAMRRKSGAKLMQRAKRKPATERIVDRRNA